MRTEEVIVRMDRIDQFREIIKPYGEIINCMEFTPSKGGAMYFIVAVGEENAEKVRDAGFKSFIDNSRFQNLYKP